MDVRTGLDPPPPPVRNNLLFHEPPPPPRARTYFMDSPNSVKTPGYVVWENRAYKLTTAVQGGVVLAAAGRALVRPSSSAAIVILLVAPDDGAAVVVVVPPVAPGGDVDGGVHPRRRGYLVLEGESMTGHGQRYSLTNHSRHRVYDFLFSNAMPDFRKWQSES